MPKANIRKDQSIEIKPNIPGFQDLVVVPLYQCGQVESRWLSADLIDALHSGNLEYVVEPDTDLHRTLVANIERSVHSGAVKDVRKGKAKSKKTVQELFEIFKVDVSNQVMHIAQTRFRFLAYSVNQIYTERFVEHDVAEQLMVYKRDNKELGYKAVCEFLQYCLKTKALGEVVVAMMGHKIFFPEERKEILQKIGVNPDVIEQVFCEIESHRDAKYSIADKRQTFIRMIGQNVGERGMYDSDFLSITKQKIPQAIVFGFTSLYGRIFGRICKKMEIRIEDADKELIDELVTIQLEKSPEMRGKNPFDYLVLDSVTIDNPRVPAKREWIENTDPTCPQELLLAIIQNYSVEYSAV